MSVSCLLAAGSACIERDYFSHFQTKPYVVRITDDAAVAVLIASANTLLLCVISPYHTLFQNPPKMCRTLT